MTVKVRKMKQDRLWKRERREDKLKKKQIFEHF